MSTPKGVDLIEQGTAAWFQRQRVWRHNALRGNAAMMRAQANSIVAADSTTAEAKSIASEIHALATQLAEALKTRIDP